jgi:Redoxin
LTYPLLLDPDGAAQRALGVQAFPTNIILDRKGVVRYAGAGFDRPAIDRTLAALARE